jgi:hypothetical protein
MGRARQLALVKGDHGMEKRVEDGSLISLPWKRTLTHTTPR